MEGRDGVRRFRSAAARIAVWTLGSRILGLVRDRMMFGLFGRGVESGAFLLAWTVPNLLRRLFGEGALSAAFVPVLTKRREDEGHEAARRSFAAVFGVLAALLCVLTGAAWLIVLFLPESWLAGGAGSAVTRADDYAVLLRSLLLILLPYAVPICLLALFAGAQNVAGRFALPAAAPIVLNAFWIAGLLIVAGVDAPGSEKAMWLAGCLMLGGVAQLGLQIPGLVRSGFLVRPRFEPANPDIKRIARDMAPMILGLSVVQLNILAMQLIAAFMVPEAGANGIMFLATRMLEFPHSLLGIALGTAVFPLLSVLGVRSDRGELGRTVDHALSIGLFLAIPAAGGLLVLAPQIIDVLFVQGRFAARDGVETALVLRILSLSLPGLVSVQVLARAHYAIGDKRRPVKIAVSCFVGALVVSVSLVPLFGTAGLGLASALSSVANALWLLASLRRHLQGAAVEVRAPLTSLKALAATGPTCLVAWVTARSAAAWVGGDAGFLERLSIELGVPVVFGVVVFLVVAKLLRASELDEVWERLRRR